MKIRSGFVSNSSSSSFLVPADVALPDNVVSFNHPESIWKAIEKYHIDWNNRKLDLSGKASAWKLTRMISDCEEVYSSVSDIPNSEAYLEGNEMPYGCYEDGYEKNYIVLKKGGDEFYIYANDITGGSPDDLPRSIWLRDKAEEIFANKSLNKTQKLSLLMHIFDF